MTLNGETYESPKYYTTLQQAEHLAAEVALDALANRGLSNTLATRILVILNPKLKKKSNKSTIAGLCF
ncbi:hypothetical protein HanPSC8_Chr10g0414351 [Helianthus annuus]|nr:hypothetical protein HanPSC8_Chr10g0414351 [Helianthus annuus]